MSRSEVRVLPRPPPQSLLDFQQHHHRICHLIEQRFACRGRDSNRAHGQPRVFCLPKRLDDYSLRFSGITLCFAWVRAECGSISRDPQQFTNLHRSYWRTWFQTAILLGRRGRRLKHWRTMWQSISVRSAKKVRWHIAEKRTSVHKPSLRSSLLRRVQRRLDFQKMSRMRQQTGLESMP